MNQYTDDHSTWIHPFESAQAASTENGLALVGGKGANLARLAQAGLPVPGGFLVTTQAYREFLTVNNLEERILSALPHAADPGPIALEDASRQIRLMFLEGCLPPGLAEALSDAYRKIGRPPVAVRSSATAEDLPEMSFAGQQDTYLNVMGEEALLQAVVACWASLWTARAIGYRTRNFVSQQGAALAVVVQRMVESETSGVLFTANPLTGRRTETVIDAAFGLGEAIVSGKVEPDHYVVDTARGAILEKSLGAKTVSIHGQVGGGTQQREEDRRDQQTLTDEQILELARMGQQVAELYGTPQDIEWAFAGGALYLLQSRAITSLYPTPEGVPPEPLKVFFSFGAVQGMLDPITPVGQNILKLVAAMGAGLYGIRHTADTQTVFIPAGERLWINITTLFRNTVGHKVLHVALDLMEPTVKQALIALWDEPALQPERKGIRRRAMLQIARFVLPLAGNILLNILSPRKRREFIVNNGERLLQVMSERTAGLTGTPRERLMQIADLLPQVMKDHMPPAFLLFVSAVAAGMASFNIVRMLSKGTAEGGNEAANQGAWSGMVLELTRGLPHNPTTEMDLALWHVARAIQSDPEMMEAFRVNDAHSLAARYQAGDLSHSSRELIGRFLDRYGARGLGEIDLGRPRWDEDPTHIFEMLASYIQIDRPDQAPDVVFARGERAALDTLNRLEATLRQKRGGWFKARAAHFFAGRMRELMGARESPKFFAVRLFGLVRASLLRIGAELVHSGELDQPDDLFYLSFNEMKAFAAQEPRDWRHLVTERRETYRRERMRRQVPRVLLSDGRAFYEGIIDPAAAGNTMMGSPVSPGSVEGNVRVVLDPRQANLKPGEILVCPGTDPSWTPLFLSAGGLVMEVGGMMTHGAVVAREYGIPAIVGVDQATHRLQTGQRVRIDGSSGIIVLLEVDEDSDRSPMEQSLA